MYFVLKNITTRIPQLNTQAQYTIILIYFVLTTSIPKY